METLRNLQWIATHDPLPILMLLFFSVVAWYSLKATWKMEMAGRRRPVKVDYAFLRTNMNVTQMPREEILQAARGRRAA